MSIDILKVLNGKWEDGTRPKDIYKMYVVESPEKYINIIVEGLGSPQRKVQSGCAELASLLSEDRPELLYHYLQLFLDNLGAKKPVLKWEAVCTLGNFAAVDEQGKILEYIDVIKPFLKDKSIVLQGHTVRALAKIAKASPKSSEDILETLINVKVHFPKNRVGFIIDVMMYFDDYEELRPKIREFVEPYLESDVKVVARKAKKALKNRG